MIQATRSLVLVTILVVFTLSACAPASTQIAPTTAPTETIPPTRTPEPTVTPTPTPFPGQLLVPVEALGFAIPWLPLDRSLIPMLVYYGFNVDQPPFDLPQVRQAFAAALDTQALTEIYTLSPFYNNEVAARTMIPAQTLSRDLSGAIGIPFDPDLARGLLADAGYADPASFPATNLLVVYPRWADYPGIMVNAATEAIRMWQENLGVTVTLEVVGVENGLQEQLDLINSGQYQIFEHGVWAGSNDPSQFIDSMFLPYGANNLTGFDDDNVTLLVNNASLQGDPNVRLPIYLELERILSEEQLPVIPLFHCTLDGSQW